MVIEKIVVGQYEDKEYHIIQLEVSEHRGIKFIDVDIILDGEQSSTFEVYPHQAKKLIKLLSKIIENDDK